MMESMSEGLAAAQLRERGILHLPNLLSAEELAICRNAANDRFAAVLRAMLLKQVLRLRNGQAPLPTKFVEVVERDGGRLDVRHSLCDAPIATVLAAVSRTGLAAVLADLLGQDAQVVAGGNVVAMSIEGWTEHMDTGADEDVVLGDSMGAQAWHADGPHLFASAVDEPAAASLPAHALNIFVPLVDLTEANGATEFACGTHRRGHELTPRDDDDDGAAASDGGDERGERTAILARAGDALVFDYRLWHRGLPNLSSADRPLLYLVAARSWWRDDRNYRQGASLFEQPPAVRGLPPSDSSASAPAAPARDERWDERVPLVCSTRGAAPAARAGEQTSPRRSKRRAAEPPCMDG